MLDFAGDDGDGILQAEEILRCASRIGDKDEAQKGKEEKPKKVNMNWAETIVRGILGTSSGERDGLGFEHYVGAILKMRAEQDADANAMAKRAKNATATEGDEGEDESDDENEEIDHWAYPVTVPEGALPGTPLSVPLPGDQVVYTRVPENKKAGDLFTVPMPMVSIAEAVRAAASAASGPEPSVEIQPAESKDEASTQLKRLTPEGAGATYLKERGRQEFCVNSFLALRSAIALNQQLPPLECWMLKRGDYFAKGSMNG